MKHYLLRLLPPRPTFAADMTPAEAALMQRHVAYWAGHMQAGKVIALGPVADPRGAYGIAILSLGDDEDPAALAKQDPPLLEGQGFSFEVHPMPRVIVRPSSKAA